MKSLNEININRQFSYLRNPKFLCTIFKNRKFFYICFLYKKEFQVNMNFLVFFWEQNIK